MNMSDDSTPVQALKALWQKHAGVPEEGTEDAGRWEMLRRAAAAQGEGVAFDEWVLEHEARLDERGMLIDIRNAERRQTAALERIAAALEAGHGEPEVAPKVMQGVGLDPEPTKEGAYVRKPSIELHRGLYGFGGVYRDDAGGSWFALDLDQELRADSPDDLRDIAELFRDEFADALEWAADEWQQQLDAREVSLFKPDDNDDDNDMSRIADALEQLVEVAEA